MKVLFRFILVCALCQAAYVVRCQQMTAGILVYAIPGMDIVTNTCNDATPDAIIPFIRNIVTVLHNTTTSGTKAAGINNADEQDTVAAASKAEHKDSIVIAVNDAPATGDAVSNMIALEDLPDPLISKYANIIELDATDIDNYPLYRFIDDWYGTRYRWGGHDNKGIDCSALSQKLYNKVYGMDINRTARQQYRHCERVKNIHDAEEGDLIFFRINRLRISHVGVYLANGYFVHASRSQGVMISNLHSKYWHRRYAGCGRVEHQDKSIYESDMVQ